MFSRNKTNNSDPIDLDPKFKNQQKKHGKRADYKKLKTVSVILASEFCNPPINNRRQK